jgi:serine/threonine protein kinase
VYKKSGPREVFAVKCVPRADLRQREVDAIVTEIALLKKLKHPNIVHMEDFAWDPNYIYIIMGTRKFWSSGVVCACGDWS